MFIASATLRPMVDLVMGWEPQVTLHMERGTIGALTSLQNSKSAQQGKYLQDIASNYLPSLKMKVRWNKEKLLPLKDS